VYLPERGSNAPAYPPAVSGHCFPRVLARVFHFLGRQSTYEQHAFVTVLFSHSNLHIPGRSITRSTVAYMQQSAGACRPLSPKALEPTAGLLHYFRGSWFGCFVSLVDKAHTNRTHPTSVLYSHSGLHIPGRSITRSTVAYMQQSAGACRPSSPKAPEPTAGLLHYFRGSWLGCFVSSDDKAHTNSTLSFLYCFHTAVSISRVAH